VARQRYLVAGLGERLLASKLQILNGTGSRRPSAALTLLTGGAAEMRAVAEGPARGERQFAPRTVYLAERHVRDIDQIIDAWEQVESRRLNRSAVLRRAIEHLRTIVESETTSSHA
jgi:hypothetical protein